MLLHELCWQSACKQAHEPGRPTLSSAPGRPAKKLVATVSRASLGHAVNQSIVVQFTSEGNLRRRSRKASPTGLKLSTICRLRRTCRRSGQQDLRVGIHDTSMNSARWQGAKHSAASTLCSCIAAKLLDSPPAQRSCTVGLCCHPFLLALPLA